MSILLSDFNKLILKKIIILISKNKENMLSFLAPIIGIHGIKVNLFIEEFEKKTKKFNLDFIFPVEIIIYKINTFDLNLKLSYINFFLNDFYNNFSILYIYKLAFYKSLYNFFLLVYNYKMIRSYLKTSNKFKNINHIKYSFFIIKNNNYLLNFKQYYDNFRYINNYLNINFGFFVIINNINYTNIKHYFKILKIKNCFNLYLFYNDNIDLFNNIKNKIKVLFLKYNNNFLTLNFFDKLNNRKIFLNNIVLIFIYLSTIINSILFKNLHVFYNFFKIK